MTLTELLQSCRDAFLRDHSIEQFCQDYFNKDPWIQIGIDEKNPPGEKDCPFIVLIPGPAHEGEETPEYVYTLNVLWALISKEIKKYSYLNEQKGLYLLDEFGEIIWKTLTGISENIAMSKSIYDIEQIETEYSPAEFTEPRGKEVLYESY